VASQQFSSKSPVDYCISGMMQERARVAIKATEALRQRLVETLASFQQSMVEHAIDQWR